MNVRRAFEIFILPCALLIGGCDGKVSEPQSEEMTPMGESGGVGGAQGGNESATGGSTTTGGAGAGGAVGGGTPVPNLGEECADPGTFGCAANNPALTLICNPELEWESRETCETNEVCDARKESNTYGTCQRVLDECAGLQDGAPACQGNTAIECSDRGLEATTEHCPLGCSLGACGIFEDECGTGSNDLDCTGECQQSDSAACFECGVEVEVEAGGSTARLPSYADACVDDGGCDIRYWLVDTNSLDARQVRVTVSSDWGLLLIGGDQCAPDLPSCLMVYPGGGGTDVFIAVAKSDASLARNAVLEVVDESATCPE